MPSLASSSSSTVCSNDELNLLWISGSPGPGKSSATHCHCGLPSGSSSSECCTHTTGTPSIRARSTARATFLTTLSEFQASPITPTCTSTTSRAPELPSRTVATTDLLSCAVTNHPACYKPATALSRLTNPLG